MWTKDDLADAVLNQPAAAGLALASLPWNGIVPLTPDAITAAAHALGLEPPELWVQQLEARDLLAAFAHALLAQGVAIDTGAAPPGETDWSDHLDPLEASRFMLRAAAFRCRVYVNDIYAGTGCLMGPGLVLTAWHVVAVAAPGQPQEPAPRVSVRLSDGSTHEACLPPQYASPCSVDEWAQKVPRADSDVTDWHDVALLTLKSQAARHLGYARLPPTVPIAKSRGTVILAHFPQGADPGLGFGKTSKIRNVTARLRHDVKTDPGSSGGACFNNETQLLGVHQGVWGGRGVLIPLDRFAMAVKEDVERDLAPRQLWRLDDAPRLVVGRSLFIDSVSVSGQEGSRVRGVWVKRRNLSATRAGLGYSFDILRELLLRRGTDQALVRVPQDEIVPDLFVDIRQRVAEAGLELPPAISPQGSDATQAAPEAAARAVANLLALAINGVAQTQTRTVWFFMDNPSVTLSEPNRLALEAFIAAVLTQPRLRVVVTGIETVALAGLQFPTPGAAAGVGAGGLVVEYVGTFNRSDVLDCLAQAQEEITGTSDPAAVNTAADMALAQVLGADMNGAYNMSDLPPVLDEMNTFISTLRARRNGGGP